LSYADVTAEEERASWIETTTTRSLPSSYV
jgi:hypothetical protein